MNNPDPKFSPNEIVDYLLGSLEPERKREIEQLIFADNSFYEQVEMAQEDLLDKYAGGQLTREQSRRIEQTFLKSRYWRRRLGLSLALKREVASVQMLATAPRPINPYVYAFAASVVLAAVLGGSTFILSRRLIERDNYVSILTKERAELQRNSDSWSAEKSVIIAGLTLPAPGQTRADTLEISVPREARRVQFVLQLPSSFPEGASVNVSLLDDQKKVITTALGISAQNFFQRHPNQKVLMPAFSAEYLPSGSYTLHIVGQQAYLDRSYDFNIKRF
jgi:hypothetical protein